LYHLIFKLLVIERVCFFFHFTVINLNKTMTYSNSFNEVYDVIFIYKYINKYICIYFSSIKYIYQCFGKSTMRARKTKQKQNSHTSNEQKQIIICVKIII
jgi:hypothetical protein